MNMTKWSDRMTYQGKAVNRGTFEILKAANTILRSSRYGKEADDLTLVQGGYNKGGVSQSAGTHDGGGAIDLTAFNAKKRVRLLRSLGVAAWYRPRIAGHWDSHIHGIVVGDATASNGAKRQVTAYRKGRDGLAGNGPDPDWRPRVFPILFVGPWTANGRTGIHYCKKATQYRAEQSTRSKSYGKLKVGETFNVVATVNANGVLWSVDRQGRWVRKKCLSTSFGKKYPGAKAFVHGQKNPAISDLRTFLKRQGYSKKDRLDQGDTARVAAFQRKHKLSRTDGSVDSETWTKLQQPKK